MNELIKNIYQCEKEAGVAQIVNALIWAAVILASSWLMRGSENANMLLIVLLGGFTSTLFMIDSMRKKANVNDCQSSEDWQSSIK